MDENIMNWALLVPLYLDTLSTAGNFPTKTSYKQRPKFLDWLLNTMPYVGETKVGETALGSS